MIGMGTAGEGAMGFDVIVIGTGFGGAVSAANLAGAGMRVCILERGTWWGRSQGHRRLPESPLGLARSVNSVHRPRAGLSLRLSKKGLIELHLFSGARVMDGIGVGGSSLLYAGLSQRPPDDFFDAFPAEITKDEMEKYYLAIEDVLRPSPCPTRIDASGHLEKQAAELGMRFSYLAQAIQWGDGPDADQSIENRFRMEQRNCNLCNRCTPGCNRGAKNSLDLTLIPSALRAGAELRDLCRVDAIEEWAGGYVVHYRELRSRRRATLHAPRVVLAAGTVNTHKILFRSRSRPNGLPRLSPTLGKQISLGGDSTRSYPRRAERPPYLERGHSIEAMLEVLDDQGRRDHFVFPSAPLFLDSWLLRPLRARREQTLNLVGFGRDGADGEFAGRGRRFDLSLPEQAVVGRIYASMYKLAQTYGQREDGEPVGRWDETPRPRRIKASVHPMGGCRMGESAETGVVDHRGEVYGHPGLHVADASLFTGPTVCAPSLSIAAFAWRVSEMMVNGGDVR
jgi:cholesterol oxidase